MCARNLTRQREQHSDGMLGGRDDIPLRGIDYQYAAAGCRLDIDIVYPHPSPADDLQPAGGINNAGGYPGLTAHYQRIIASDNRLQLSRINPRPLINLGMLAENIDAGRRYRVGNQYLHQNPPLSFSKVSARASGITRTSDITGIKLASPCQRGTTWVWTCLSIPAPAALPILIPMLKPSG